MRKKLFLFTILTALVFALVACGGNDTDDAGTNDEGTTETAYEAEDVSENDVCEVCAMAVPDNQHAAQIVLTNDRSIKFDDIGCMHGWIDENGEDEIGTAFVRDFNTEEWFDFEEATFVYDEEIE
ncbi:MAG TPA: nitrous oxide reductase accessory protein NosL, partial [Pseudogracilibacillus sp.]|nr:nitrous oxide reductase accessory protein NosL [Pseudogracilibacillus sp.]